MQTRHTTNPTNRIRQGMLFGVVIGLALVATGWLLVPATNRLSITAATTVLLLYGLIGWFCPPLLERLEPRLLRWASFFGLIGGAIFAGEMLLEYVLLPADNTRMGYVEFGSVFLMYLIASVVSARQTKSLWCAVLTAIGSAIISSLIWLLVVLATFYMFRGTPQQAQVFRAEGNYEDFAHSGMHDFNAFIMEDFMGAAFFHLLLGPSIAAILGTIGGLLGKGIVTLQSAKPDRVGGE